jgi:hypothetical protein
MRNALLFVLATGALFACTDTPTETPLDVEPTLEAANDPALGPREFEVTITNLTSGQPFTPPLVTTHENRLRLWRVGQPARFEIKEIAENGNLSPMVTELGMSARVTDVVIAAGSVPPLLPGASITFNISADGRARHLSWVSMLICTNDGFTGRQLIPLPTKIGGTKVRYANSYDAGTEINTEDFADMVPPCPSLTGVPSTDPGTGMSDPALAENGRVLPHPGVAGGNDLDPTIHDWSDPTAMLSITRVN